MTTTTTTTGRQTVECGHCHQPFSTTAWQRRQGKGVYCGRECADASKRGAYRQYPTAAQKPLPVSPRVDDLPLTAGGSHVRCAGPCGQLRLRGSFCPRCEHRAAEVLGA